ncbi:MAG TPA: hypothetical protein VGC85_03670 [Chthoniobacterales bacterium]
MRRKHSAFVLVALLIVIGLWIAFRKREFRAERAVATAAVAEAPNESLLLPKDVSRSAATTAPNESSPTAVTRQMTAGTSIAASTAAPVPPDPEAMIDVDKVNLMIRDYRSVFGENPVGTNADIMAEIMGRNAKQAKLGPPEGMQLNERGELIDRWGTPYFFHQISRDHMEIHSAGPDRIMWTDDDVVIR